MSQNEGRKIVKLAILGVLVFTLTGCAEGLLWRTGNWAPWVQKKWQEEEQIAPTLFSKRQQIAEKIRLAESGSGASRDQLAQELGEIYARDPVLLTKIEAIRGLGQIPCETALRYLGQATFDSNADLRLEAIRALENMPADQALPMLAQVLGQDTSIDVRLAATRAMGKFPGEQSATWLRKQLDDRNPAIQYTAMESLEMATGQKLGRDVRAWKSMLGPGEPPPSMAENSLPNSANEPSRR